MEEKESEIDVIVDQDQNTQSEDNYNYVENSDFDSNTEDNQEEESEQQEYQEFTFGNQKISLPKGSVPDELVNELDKFTKGTWSDYTKKSQSLVEQQKSLESTMKRVEHLSCLQDEALLKLAEGLQINKDIQELQQIDMGRLWQEDANKARQVSDLLSMKQHQLEKHRFELNKLESQFLQGREAHIKEQMIQNESVVVKQVPDFLQKEQEVINYAIKSYGVSESEAKNWRINPVGAVIAYKAMMYDKMQERAKNPSKNIKPSPNNPIKSIKGSSKSQVNLKDLPMEKYVEARMKQKFKS